MRMICSNFVLLFIGKIAFTLLCRLFAWWDSVESEVWASSSSVVLIDSGEAGKSRNAILAENEVAALRGSYFPLFLITCMDWSDQRRSLIHLVPAFLLAALTLALRIGLMISAFILLSIGNHLD